MDIIDMDTQYVHTAIFLPSQPTTPPLHDESRPCNWIGSFFYFIVGPATVFGEDDTRWGAAVERFMQLRPQLPWAPHRNHPLQFSFFCSSFVSYYWMCVRARMRTCCKVMSWGAAAGRTGMEQQLTDAAAAVSRPACPLPARLVRSQLWVGAQSGNNTVLRILVFVSCSESCRISSSFLNTQYLVTGLYTPWERSDLLLRERIRKWF